MVGRYAAAVVRVEGNETSMNGVGDISVDVVEALVVRTSVHHQFRGRCRGRYDMLTSYQLVDIELNLRRGTATNNA